MVTRKKEDGHSLPTYQALKKQLWQKIISNGKGIQCDKKYDTKKPIRFIGHKKDKKMRTFTRRALQCGVKYGKKDIK